MTDFNTHIEKYLMFKADAENELNSIPTRVDAYFNACYHLIESNAAKMGLHIEKHQRVRSMLEKNHQILKNETEMVWRAFQEIENQIRPGQIYGAAINGKKLNRTIELFRIIETICGETQ